MPGGLTWGLGNKDAALPSGWRNDLDFYKYGGPGTSYSGGRLPPRIKDIIVHYFYLLGINPNYHARTVPEGYEERDLDNLAFFLPPQENCQDEFDDKIDLDNLEFIPPPPETATPTAAIACPRSSRVRRYRSPSPLESPVLPLAPQASSTMKEEADPNRSWPKIVVHIRNAGAVSKLKTPQEKGKTAVQYCKILLLL